MINSFNLNRVVTHKYLEMMSEYVYEENPLIYSIVILNPMYVRSFFYLLFGVPNKCELSFDGKFFVILMINGKVLNYKSNLNSFKYTHGKDEFSNLCYNVFEGLFLNRPNLEEYFEKNWSHYHDRNNTI